MFDFRHNLQATTFPTPSDDSLDGWDVGSFWIVPAKEKVFTASCVEPTKAVWTDLTESGGVVRFLQLKDVPNSFEDAEGYALKVGNGALVFARNHHYEAVQGRAIARSGTWYTFPMGGPRSTVWDRNLGTVKYLPSAYFDVSHKGLAFGTKGTVNSVKIFASSEVDRTEMEWRLYRNTRSNGRAEIESSEMGVLPVSMMSGSRIYIGSMKITEANFDAGDALAFAWRRTDGEEDTRLVEAEIALDLTFG